MACVVMRGLSVADMDRLTYGMLINYVREYDRLRNGITAPNEDRQYKQLKAIEPIVDERYGNGEITHEKYTEFKQSLKSYEREG